MNSQNEREIHEFVDWWYSDIGHFVRLKEGEEAGGIQVNWKQALGYIRQFIKLSTTPTAVEATPPSSQEPCDPSGPENETQDPAESRAKRDAAFGDVIVSVQSVEPQGGSQSQQWATMDDLLALTERICKLESWVHSLRQYSKDQEFADSNKQGKAKLTPKDAVYELDKY